MNSCFIPAALMRNCGMVCDRKMAMNAMLKAADGGATQVTVTLRDPLLVGELQALGYQVRRTTGNQYLVDWSANE